MALLEPLPTDLARDRHAVVLETPRLILRTPRPEDAGAIAALANDRRVVENTARLPFPYTVRDAEQFIDYATQDGGEIAFFATLANHRIIGVFGIGRAKEIGYWLGVPYWGKGYATEAARAVIDHAFTTLGLEAIQAGARVSNPASRRVLEKCGFQWTGVQLQRFRAIASSAPVDRFRLDRGLWASLRSWGKVRPIG
jgi:RimJ/RimL family protein N-acetyltransferase